MAKSIFRMVASSSMTVRAQEVMIRWMTGSWIDVMSYAWQATAVRRARLIRPRH